MTYQKDWDDPEEWGFTRTYRGCHKKPVNEVHEHLNNLIDENENDLTLGNLMIEAMKKDKHFYKGVNSLFIYYFDNLANNKSDRMVMYGIESALESITGYRLSSYLLLLEQKMDKKKLSKNPRRHYRKSIAPILDGERKRK